MSEQRLLQLDRLAEIDRILGRLSGDSFHAREVKGSILSVPTSGVQRGTP